MARLADRIAVIYAFEFVETGPREEILYDAAHPYTRALLNAAPNLGVDPDEMEPISGSSQDPVDTPVGCSYHPRCPLADDLCVEAAPPMHEVTDGHEAACYYWEDVTEIPELRLPERDGPQ